MNAVGNMVANPNPTPQSGQPAVDRTYIRSYRSRLEEPIQKNANLAHLLATLELMANSKEGYQGSRYGRGVTVTPLAPGQLVIGMVSFARFMGWGKMTTKRRLQKLEEMGYIVIECTPFGTLITICFWKENQPPHGEARSPSYPLESEKAIPLGAGITPRNIRGITGVQNKTYPLGKGKVIPYKKSKTSSTTKGRESAALPGGFSRQVGCSGEELKPWRDDQPFEEEVRS